MASKVTKFITISIGSSEIKLAELDSSKKNISVLWAETVPTPPDAYDEGEIVDIEKISKSIKQTIFKNRINAKHVIFTVHGPKFANKEIIIPNVKKDKIKSAIDANCAEYFPINTEEYVFSYSILEHFVQEGRKQMRLMVVAAPGDIIESYYTLADRLGMKLECIDYAGNSTLQLIRQQVENAPNIVIQVNKATTVVSILKNGILQMQRTIPYGKNVLLNAVMDEKQVDESTAEELIKKEKMIHPSFDGDQVTDSLRYMVANLSRVVDYYTTRNQDSLLEKAYLITDGVDVPGLRELLTNELNIPIVIMNELKNVNGSKYYEMPDNHLMNYMENLGTVIEPINFVSKKHIESLQKKEVKHNNVALIAGSVIISGLLVLPSLWSYKKTTDQRNKLIMDIESIQDVEQIVNAYYDAKDKVADLLGFTSNTYSDNDSVLYMYNKLEEVMPSDISLSSISFNNGQVSLSATGSSKLCVAKFLEELEKLENVYDIQISGVSESKDEENNITESFSLTFKFLKAESEGEADENTDAEPGSTVLTESNAEQESTVESEINAESAPKESTDNNEKEAQ